MKKLLLLIFSVLWILESGYSQTPGQSLPADSTALILIDIQDFYFPGGTAPLDHPEEAAAQAARALSYFRNHNVEVVHVKHAARKFADIYVTVKPEENEKVFTKRDVNAFLNTGLHDYLQSKHIRYLVFGGMMTHMCLEAGVRAAHDLGYSCIVLSDACATRNLEYKGKVIKSADVHYSTLATLDRYYGKVIDTDTFLKNYSWK